MNEIPAKIYALVGAETGLFVGMGIIIAITLRSVRTATVNHTWAGFNTIENIKGNYNGNK